MSNNEYVKRVSLNSGSEYQKIEKQFLSQVRNGLYSRKVKNSSGCQVVKVSCDTFMNQINGNISVRLLLVVGRVGDCMAVICFLFILAVGLDGIFYGMCQPTFVYVTTASINLISVAYKYVYTYVKVLLLNNNRT